MEGVRRLLAGMIGSKARLRCHVAKIVTIDDVALVY